MEGYFVGKGDPVGTFGRQGRSIRVWEWEAGGLDISEACLGKGGKGMLLLGGNGGANLGKRGNPSKQLKISGGRTWGDSALRDSGNSRNSVDRRGILSGVTGKKVILQCAWLGEGDSMSLWWKRT